ncbi:MAG: M48 family metallopeptidase [Thermodesulfovibrionia bacterium]|nr:M48 family metallopeptidase [Thermodesulfovibrionia bacterium]
MNIYLIFILIAYILITAFGYLLDYLNLSHLEKHGSVIPQEFEGKIDQELLTKTRNYTVEKTQFGFISSGFDNVILLLFLFGGILNIYNSWVASMQMHFILSGLAFFLLLTYAQTIISTPFSLYSTFRIEKKYGFNTMTMKLWIMDFIKSLLLSTVLMGILLSVGLLLIQKSPELWWFYLWCFFFAFTIFMMYISPYVLEPLFNKFTPIDDEEFVDDIKKLMQKAGIKVSRVFKMDASKRSKHTNAYFSGIGKVKRIVLFDTLLEKLDKDEIIAVLAHEAGHWKKKHLLKMLAVTELIALIVMFIAYKATQSNFLIELFNINESTFFAKVILLSFIFSIASFPFSPLFNQLSRRHEKEADRFSYELTGDTDGMIGALVKLSKDNLSNLHPHPLYALFHYSHPPVLERIRQIKELKK